MQNNATKISKKDCAFLGFAFALCAGICAFTFWLGFPGFHIIGDTYASIELVKNNYHPVFIAYILQGLYAIFGKNLYYLFLFNLIPFYLGIFFLVAGFYLRFKNPFALILIFPTFIGNIYFQNFIQYHSFALPMMLFCIYSALLFLILAPLKVRMAKILWIFLFVLMFFAILWRHNAIFGVFPAFFIIIYLWLKDQHLDSMAFLWRYIGFVALSAFVCIAIVVELPKRLPKSYIAYPTNHIFLLQIAGACVPANDTTCFKDEWYYFDGKVVGFESVKEAYQREPMNGDLYLCNKARIFECGKLYGLTGAWLKAILKHPINFLYHEARFFKAMWWQNPAWIFDSKKMQEKATHEWHISITKDFKESQRSIVFSPLKEKIYTFLYNHKILLNHAWSVGVGFVILVLSSVILWKRRKDIFTNMSQNNALLVFCFAVSFASFWSAFFIAAFSPVPETRYMSPILPMSIVALVGFVAFVFEMCAKKA